MKNISPAFSLLFTMLAILSYGQSEKASLLIDIPKGAVPWNHLEFKNDPGNFQFAIVTDRTGGHRPGVFMDGVNKLNLLQPEFVMSVGDLIEGYTTDSKRLNTEWKEFNSFIDQLETPFFYVPGNHDITNRVMEDKWKSLFGKTYYHFVYNDVLFLCLNSEDNYLGAGRGTIDDAQFEYIEKTLTDHCNVRWTLVFMHQPLWGQQNTKRWEEVENMLSDRKHTVFAGHNHRYKKFDRNNGKYFVLATTGGGSQLRGPNLGEFDHVVWVTMTDKGPIIANLLLEGIWDENVVTNDFARIIFPMSGNSTIKVEPVFVSDKKFEKINSSLKVTNDSDFALEASIGFNASQSIIPGFTNKTIQVAPNSVETIELKLRNVLISNEEFDLLRMNTRLTYDIPNRPEVKFNNLINIKPERKEYIYTSPSKIQVDGDLKEWDDLKYNLQESSYRETDVFSDNEGGDLKVHFDVVHDDNNIYFSAAIKDDEILAKQGINPLQQDAVFFVIDARPIWESSQGRGENKYTQYLSFGISATREGTLYQADRLPAGIQWALKSTKKGYNVEISIPVTYLNQMQKKEWENFRFNFACNDVDKEGRHKTLISWRPIWESDDNYIGSGTFFRKTKKAEH